MGSCEREKLGKLGIWKVGNSEAESLFGETGIVNKPGAYSETGKMGTLEAGSCS